MHHQERRVTSPNQRCHNHKGLTLAQTLAGTRRLRQWCLTQGSTVGYTGRISAQGIQAVTALLTFSGNVSPPD